MHKTTQSIADTDGIWTEIDTDIVAAIIRHKSLSIRKQLGHEQYYYQGKELKKRKKWKTDR